MRQITNDNLVLCFNCQGETGFYYEFEDMGDKENPVCPQCRQERYTMPKYYLEEMTIPTFQNVMSLYADITPWLPILDLKFKDYELPGAIICDYKISNKGA